MGQPEHGLSQDGQGENLHGMDVWNESRKDIKRKQQLFLTWPLNTVCPESREGVLIPPFRNKSAPGILEPPPLTPTLIKETELLPSLKLKSRVMDLTQIWVQHVAPAGQYPPCLKRTTPE